MRDEAHLIRKAVAGDRGAFDELLAPHTHRAYRTACLITHEAIKQCKRASRVRRLHVDLPPAQWPEFLMAPATDTPEIAFQVREQRM